MAAISHELHREAQWLDGPLSQRDLCDLAARKHIGGLEPIQSDSEIRDLARDMERCKDRALRSAEYYAGKERAYREELTRRLAGKREKAA